MKTFEHPPCPRRSSRLRPKASPVYARGRATPLTLKFTLQQSPTQIPLVLCLGPLPLSPRPITPFPMPRLIVSYLRLVPSPNKTGSDKTLYDRIRQDPQNGSRQDPPQSAPLPLLLLHDSPTPTPSNLYLCLIAPYCLLGAPPISPGSSLSRSKPLLSRAISSPTPLCPIPSSGSPPSCAPGAHHLHFNLRLHL
jgi:hypothetical protein